MKNDERLRRIIEKFSKADIQAMEGGTRIKDLKFDSLDLLEFQMAIDDEFGIEIAIDDFLKCLGCAVVHLSTHILQSLRHARFSNNTSDIFRNFFT